MQSSLFWQCLAKESNPNFKFWK